MGRNGGLSLDNVDLQSDIRIIHPDVQQIQISSSTTSLDMDSLVLVDESVDTTDASVLAAVGNALDIASISARSDDSTTFAVRTVATGSDTPSESTLSVTPRTTPKIRIAKENNIATVRMEAGAGVERIKLKKQDATASEESCCIQGHVVL